MTKRPYFPRLPLFGIALVGGNGSIQVADVGGGECDDFRPLVDQPRLHSLFLLLVELHVTKGT